VLGDAPTWLCAGTEYTLVIKLAAVANPDHDDFLEPVVNFIANPPVADTDSPNTFCVPKFNASGRTGIGS
jgi:hypothetical protein